MGPCTRLYLCTDLFHYSFGSFLKVDVSSSGIRWEFFIIDVRLCDICWQQCKVFSLKQVMIASCSINRSIRKVESRTFKATAGPIDLIIPSDIRLDQATK